MASSALYAETKRVTFTPSFRRSRAATKTRASPSPPSLLLLLCPRFAVAAPREEEKKARASLDPARRKGSRIHVHSHGSLSGDQSCNSMDLSIGGYTHTHRQRKRENMFAFATIRCAADKKERKATPPRMVSQDKIPTDMRGHTHTRTRTYLYKFDWSSLPSSALPDWVAGGGNFEKERG